IGVSTLRFQDFSLPISERPKEAWITRWRLEKKDPAAEISEPKTPIVFYFDPAIPDPLRQAMKEGALWWNAAFEQAGFRNAVQAVDAPPDMDPMDIRYAYVLWIERDERGFSSGGTYRDPRTGEILGAKTRMDSHRIRTVANYFDAYSGALPADGTGVTIADPGLLTPEGLDGMPPAQRDMVLVRQALLTAHELGHVLGFGHNFASSLNDRASVMEYPTPRVAVRNGRLDISEAFQKAIGAYDTAMVRYAYSVFPDEAERDGLNGVIADMRADGLIYVPPTDPRWTWYDDRASPTEYLRETLAARALMLDGFGQDMLSPGEPVGALRDMRLWMAYLHHRWAIERGQGYVGGLYQNIVLKGDDIPPTEFVPGALQREVLALLLEGLRPEQLSIPEALLAQLTPDPNPNLEDLSTDAVFDQVKAARVLSAMILEPLFDKQKAARLVALGARQPDALTFPEMVQAVLTATWNAAGDPTPQARALRRAAQAAALDSMMILGAQADASPEARAYVLDELAKLSASLKTRRESDPLSLAFQRQSARDIDRYLEDPAAQAPKSAMPAWGATPRSRFPMPPGPPLGG
ncbi:MAG: zinc-dependent metalloprotease, partial [Caulobacteraceae bacterium]|nr:zinc-dependent metalloprotease [Caulobacteraceae bacterium]